jgi:hypothetical protein
MNVVILEKETRNEFGPSPGIARHLASKNVGHMFKRATPLTTMHPRRPAQVRAPAIILQRHPKTAPDAACADRVQLSHAHVHGMLLCVMQATTDER